MFGRCLRFSLVCLPLLLFDTASLAHDSWISRGLRAEASCRIGARDHQRGICGGQQGRAANGGGPADAAQRIAALRYGAGDYFWINDMHPRMVMHPTKPELNGTDLTDNKDQMASGCSSNSSMW
jgi:cache domain-containing protein